MAASRAERHSNGGAGSPAPYRASRVLVVATKGTGALQARAASKRAAEAMAERARRFAEREKEVERLLTAFHLADERGRNARANAEERAAKLTAETGAKVAALREKAASEAADHDAEAAAAVRGMAAAGEALEVIVELTGWPLAKVRQAQRGEGGPSRADADT